MNTQPEHQSVSSTLGELCVQSIVDIEKRLQLQKESDEAISRQLEEEKRVRLEQEQLAAEKAEKERVEQLKKLEDERALIAAAERELALKK